MGEYGFMGVDWEERIDFDRLRRERLQKAKDALAKSDLDALFVFRREDVRYLTGFRMTLNPVPTFGLAAVVLPKGGEPIIFTILEDHVKARMPWMRPENVLPPPNLREGLGMKTWAAQIRKCIGSLVDGTIGVDIWTPTMTKSFHQAFPKATFVDGYSTLLEAKIIKTQDEIECLKSANIITEAGLDAALSVLKPGIRECEVLAEAWRAMTALGSEWTQCSNVVCSGPYTAPYRLFTSDRIIRKGDIVIIDIGGCFNGYWGDFTRTWVCGDIRPTEEQKDLHQKCYNALFAACAAAQPGATNAEVYRAAQPYTLRSLGHGSGTSPWEPPYFMEESQEHPMTLRPGMVMNLEPYSGKPGVGGFRLENNLLLTETGQEIYTTYPFDERLLDDIHPLDSTTGRTRK